MPKKKQHRGPHKDLESQYTVSDCDSPQCASDLNESDVKTSDWKYGHRQIKSNWDRYRTESPKESEGDDQDSKSVNDFATFLSSPSDCNYFQFKSEKRWESEAIKSSFSGLKLFNLDIELLCSGLASIPFYDRVDIDKNILSEYDIERCDKIAEEKLQRYIPMKELFLKRQVHNSEVPIATVESPIILEAVEKDASESKQDSYSGGNNSLCKEEQLLKRDSESCENTKSPSQGTQNAHDVENLEDWLDSVLDE